MSSIIFRLSIVTFLLTVLTGCTGLQRLIHMYGDEALEPRVFRYPDGGRSIYYTFYNGNSDNPEIYIFFYGGTGCPSWKSVMPGYVDGLSVPARVFVLNKRFVTDRSLGMFGCGEAFHKYNNIEQWISDYSDFITSQLNGAEHPPQKVVLVGVSEGAIQAVRVAGKIPRVTHLAIIGNGGYTMRKSLKTLHDKGLIYFDVDTGWEKIRKKKNSIEDSWYGNTYRWWTEIMDYDPIPWFLRLDIPILVGMGAEDTSVPVESARFLKEAFTEAGKTNLTLKVYPQADHRLNSATVSYRKDFFSVLGRMLKPDGK